AIRICRRFLACPGLRGKGPAKPGRHWTNHLFELKSAPPTHDNCRTGAISGRGSCPPVVATGRMKATFSTVLIFVGVAAACGAPARPRAEYTRSTPITAPLRALTNNPNYFTDGTGKAVYLTGSHTWNNFQDWGTDGSPEPFDFTAYVKMLVTHNHNFTLLWQTELPAF